MLAMYVCYDNPTPMVADYPAAYINQPGFDFLMRVPTWWDETRVLIAEAGKLLVSARRKGAAWYIGGLAARNERDLELPLGFLPAGRYNARVWKDGSDTEIDPNQLVTETIRVASDNSLKVHVARDGGFVVTLEPREP